MTLTPELESAANRLQIAITRPQLVLLFDLFDRPHYVASYYPPARILIKNGYAYSVEKDGRTRLTETGTSLALKIMEEAEKGKR